MDKQIFENYLLVLKGTVEVYIHGTLESSNIDVHDALKSGLDNILLMQEETYQLMQNNNWYQINNVNGDVIRKTLNKLENEN